MKSVLQHRFALLLTLHTALRANNSLEIPLGFKLKVLLQSQLISYYILYIDIYNKYRYH